MMTRDQHGHHRRRSPESERRRRKERRSSREQVLSNLQHVPEPDRYQQTNAMRQEPSGSHDYYDSQSAAQRSSYYAHPPPPPSQSHYGPSRARSSSSNSSSSSTSSSLLNISRRDRPFGLKTFFTAASERRKRRLRKQRSRRMFRFGNGSSSSDLSDMAYGRGYIDRDRRRSRDFTPPGPMRHREGSESGTRPPLPKREKTDEEIIELGRKFAEIARQQNKEDLRRAGRHKPSALLGAAAALSAYKKTSGSGPSDRGVGSSKHSRHDSSDESEWESASEDESSSGDDDLVYGSAVNLPTGGHHPIHISSPPHTSRPGEYEKMLQHKASIVDPKLFGPVNSLRGIVNTPCGFDKVDRRTISEGYPGPMPADGSASVSQSEAALFENRPMQNVYPVPTSNPNVYKTSRGSIASFERDRPAPVPIQHPKPIAPVSSKVYDTAEADARYSRKSSSSGTALAGAAAAGLAGAAIASVIADRKDKEDRREDRESRRERESEKERDRERDEKRRSRRSDPKYAESVYSESRHGDEREEKRRSKRSDDKYAGSKYADSQIGDDRDEKRRSKRSEDKSTNEREEKRKSRDDDRDLERAERRREKERIKELEREASKQAKDTALANPPDFSNPIVDRNYGIQHGREYRGLDRREDRKREQERREEKMRLEELERREEMERRERGEKPVTSRSSEADTYRRIEDQNNPSARGPIDPFQFQVANDAFATPQRPLTPNVFTVEREPDFADLGDDYDQPMERLSRKDSYERELRDAEAIYDSTRTSTAPISAAAIAAATAAIGMEQRRGRSTSRGGDESSRHREDHIDVVQDVANILYRRDMLARQAEEARTRSESPDPSIVDKWRSEPESSKSGITTPPAKDVPKPKSPYDGPDADVRIDHILSPKDLPLRPNGRPFKSRDPSAERERPMLNIVRPTPVPTPQPERQQAREELREESPEEFREFKKDSKKKKKKNPPLVEQYRARDDVATNTRSEVSSTPSTPTSKGVTWGENETRRYVVESPERSHDDVSGARVVVPAESPKSKSGKKSGWGILASAIAGTGAAAAASALSDSGKDKDADETSSHVSTSSKKSRDRDSPREKDIDRYETSSNVSSSSKKSKDRDSLKDKDRDETSSIISSGSRKSRDRDSLDFSDKHRDDITSNISSSSRRSRDRDTMDKDEAGSVISSSSRKSRGSPPKDKRSSFVSWDEAEDPPVPGPKPSSSRGSPMPGSFAEDLAFTATIAAGLQDSGFDPNLVIDDAKYHRRDSPPNASDKGLFYQSPFSETVSDLGKIPVAPTGSAIGSEPGFVLGEIPETPQDERDLPTDAVDLSKLSKKERKKLEKAAKRASVDDYDLRSQIVVEEEPESFQAASEPIVKEEDDWASTTKLSKKEQKKRDKAARAKSLQEEESALSTPRDSEPETPLRAQDEDEWATSSKLSKKEKKKLEKAAKTKALQEEEFPEVLTPQETQPQAIEPVLDEWEDTYSSKKSKKDKKKEKSIFADEDTNNFNDSTNSKVSVPVDAFRDIQEEAQLAQPEDDWSVPSKKSKKKSKRDSVTLDWATESTPPADEASQRDIQEEASFGQPEDAWSTSSKKGKKKSKRDSEIFASAVETPLPSEDSPRDFAEESTTVQPEDDWSAPTSKKSKKKSKRNSEIYDSPSQSMILPEVETPQDVQESSSAQPADDWSVPSKKSKKKSKRDSEIYDSPSRSAPHSEFGEPSYKDSGSAVTAFLDDEWDDPKKSKKNTKQDSFATDNTDWTNVPSVVSESMIKSQSTDDFSIAEAAGGDDWDVPVKKSKKKSTRDSTTYDSPSQTPNERNDIVGSPKAMTDSFADIRSDKSGDPIDDAWSETKKSKKSKRHSYHEALPEADNGSESSERRSKKEKRRSLPGGFPDDFDVPDQGDPPDRGRDDYPFVDNDVSSVVSVPIRDRSEKRKSRSRFDDLDDDAKSIASAPGGSRKRDSKSEKDKEKRNSTGSGFFDRFKSSIGIVDDKDKSSRDDDKKSLKDNAGTLGASVGLLGAAAALIKSQMSPTNATDVPSEEKEALSDPITPSRQRSPSPSQRRLSDSIDPEIVEREIRPAIDPQYGDLLPLPPSPPPGSPKTHETDELPALPDSRPETPEHERQLRREMLNKPIHIRRKSTNETPVKMKSPSQSAIPLRFGMKGKRPSEPSSPVTARRLTPASSPIATPVESLSAGKARPARPTSWDSSREVKPLYLVERSSLPAMHHNDYFPKIADSGSSSLSPYTYSEGHEAGSPYEHAQSLPHDAPLGLDIPAALAENDPAAQPGSQETTPKARDLPDTLVTPPQIEHKLEDFSSSLPEKRGLDAPQEESLAPNSTELKDEIPTGQNVGLGLMTDDPATTEAAVALLDDTNLPVDDAKVEPEPLDFSPVASKKSKKGKKGKKNKQSLDWATEPDSTAISAEDVSSFSAPQVDLPTDDTLSKDQHQDILSDVPTPTLESSTRPFEEVGGAAPEPESVYATPMDFGAAPADGFTFAESAAKEPEILPQTQESTDAVTTPVNIEDTQAAKTDDFALPAKKGKKKKKGKKSESFEPELEPQLESGLHPLSEGLQSSIAEPTTSDEVTPIPAESTPSHDESTSYSVTEPHHSQELLVAHQPEDTSLSRTLEAEPFDSPYATPLGEQLPTGASGLETANMDIESSGPPAEPAVEDAQVENMDTTETSGDKPIDFELPGNVVAESMQPDPAGLDSGGPPQDPLSTNDPRETAIVDSTQAPTPEAVEVKHDLEAVPDVIPSVTDHDTVEPTTEWPQEVGGKKKKNKKDKKRQSTPWEPEPVVPAEVPLPQDLGSSEAPSEVQSVSNEAPPLTQHDTEAAPDDIWSAPVKSGKKGKKGKKNRQSVILDESTPLPSSEPASDSPTIHEDSKDLPSEPIVEQEPLSTSWADEVEEISTAMPEPTQEHEILQEHEPLRESEPLEEPQQAQEPASGQPLEIDPEAEFTVSKKKSKKDKKKKNRASQFDDTPDETPAEQSQIEMTSQEPVHEALVSSTSEPVTSLSETRDISDPEPEKEVTDDLWPTSSKKSKKKKKKGQLAQWEDAPSASETPQDLQESNSSSFNFPAGASEEQPRDIVAVQEPADVHGEPQLETSSEIPEFGPSAPQEQATQGATDDYNTVASVTAPNDPEARNESTVPVTVPEDIAPASHAVSQIDQIVPSPPQDEVTASQEQVETQTSEQLQPALNDKEMTLGEPASAPVDDKPMTVTETTGDDEQIKPDEQPTAIAEEEFPLTKKSKKDKKKKKRQSKIDDLLDSGTSTPKEETSLDAPEAQTEPLQHDITQDEAQSREIDTASQPPNKDETAEPGDQQLDDEWASFSTKKSKKDKKKKKKGSQNIDTEPEAEQPVLEGAQSEPPSSSVPTSAADIVLPESPIQEDESVSFPMAEERSEPLEIPTPATDPTDAATQPDREITQDARDIPVAVPSSIVHDNDQLESAHSAALTDIADPEQLISESPREPTIASHGATQDALPDAQLEIGNDTSPTETTMVAEGDTFTPTTSKKNKKKKKRQSLAQESEVVGSSSFDTVVPDEPQGVPVLPLEEPSSTLVEQSTNAQKDEPGESLSRNQPDRMEPQESHELTERSLIDPDEASIAQPIPLFTENQAIEPETSIPQDQPLLESQQQETPFELSDQPTPMAPFDIDSSSQQISNPELIEEIKHITDAAGDDAELPTVIQVGETLLEVTPDVATEGAANEKLAQDESSSAKPSYDAQELLAPTPDLGSVAETALAEEDPEDFWGPPKSKKDKKKKKRAGQSLQEDPVALPAEISPPSDSRYQDPESGNKQDLTDEISQQPKELQAEDAAISTPIPEDEAPLAMEPEFSNAKKSKKDKKKKKQAFSSWTDDLPRDQVEAPQAEVDAIVDAPVDAEVPADIEAPADVEAPADIEVPAEHLSSALPVTEEEPGLETPLQAETSKDDEFTGFTSGRKSKKDKKKKKQQLANPWDEEVQQEQTQPSEDPVQADTIPSLEEAAEAEASTPAPSAPIEEPFEFIPAKKSKKDKKKKKIASSWELEEPQEAEALPNATPEPGTFDATPGQDLDAAVVDSPNVPKETANDDDFSGFTSSKKSKKDKKKKRASAWEPEPEPEQEAESLTTISRDEPTEPAIETPLAHASPAAEPVTDEHMTQAPQQHSDTHFDQPSIVQDADASQVIQSDIPEDLQPKREENDSAEVVDELSRGLPDLGQAPPSIVIEAPHDSEATLEQRQTVDEQQVEMNADDQLFTEPSTVFATPLGALTPQEDARDLPEATQPSSSAQEIPDPEPDSFVTKKSKKDKKKKKQASQLEDFEREPSVPPTTESPPPETVFTQTEVKPDDDNALPETQETQPEDSFPEFVSTKKSKKDKKKKKASQAQDWEAETEFEPESAFMTPLEEPENQMDRQLPDVSTALSTVDEHPVEAESFSTAQPDPAVIDVTTDETALAPSTVQSEDVFSEMPTGKKSKKDKKKKRASQFQDWEADTSPSSPALEEPIAASAADINTGDTEQIPDEGGSDPKEPETSETVFPEFAMGKKSKKDKKKAKAALTPDLQEPDSFYTPMEETHPVLNVAEDVAMREPAIEPAADDLSASKDVQPEDEFPEFVSSKKSKKDKKKKKGLSLDWEEPAATSTESTETRPSQDIASEAPVVEAPVEAPVEVPVEAPVEVPVEAPVEVPVEAPVEITHDVASEYPEIQAEDEFPEFTSAKKSKKDKKKAKKAAALAAIADLEPGSSTQDPSEAEANFSLPAEPEPVPTSEAPIASSTLESTGHREAEIVESRAEPIDERNAQDPMLDSSLEAPAETKEASTSELKDFDSVPVDQSATTIPEDAEKTAHDRSLPVVTDLPMTPSADAVTDLAQDEAAEFPEFSVKKSKKDKKKAKKAKAAEPLPWEDDALATGAQTPSSEHVPSQPNTQEPLLPAPEMETGVAEMSRESTVEERKSEEVPADVVESQLPIDVALEAPSEQDPSASKDVVVNEFPLTRKKSKKDKKKAKAAALLASEPTFGAETPVTQDEQAIDVPVPESLPAVDLDESTTREVTGDVPVEEPLQLNIGGKLVSEEPESSQQANDDWSEFGSKKSKKNKKKSKSTIDFEPEPTPEVLMPSAEEPELSRDLDVVIPDVEANDTAITEQPIFEEPSQAAPADDEWPQYSTKKSKKDKKKRKATGNFESEPASGAQTPLTQETPMEESSGPAAPPAEQAVEEAAISSALMNVPESPAPVEEDDDDWSNFTTKKSKKDKGKKKGKTSGSATPAEASVPFAEASRAALTEEAPTIESSKAKDVWDDDSFFQPKASFTPSYQDEGFSRSPIIAAARPATPVKPSESFAAALSPAVDVDLSPAQLTSHVDHDKPFDQTTQPGKKVRTNTFLGDTEIPEPISAIEPEPVAHGSDILAPQESVDTTVGQSDMHTIPETKIEEPASQPDRVPSPAPTAREIAADYLDPDHGKHSHRQDDKMTADWKPEYSSPLRQATPERDLAVSYLELHSHRTRDVNFEPDRMKNDPFAKDPMIVPPSEVRAAYSNHEMRAAFNHHESQAVTGDNDHRGVVVAEYPPKVDQPSPRMNEFARQDLAYDVSNDFAKAQSTKSKDSGKSPIGKDEIEKEDGANDAEALAAAAALTGGVAMLANRFGGAKKVKVKKGKKSKYVDKRQPQEDDIFDDPMLWESSERKIMTGNDGGRLDTDTGDFWDVQDEMEDTEEARAEPSASKETDTEGTSTGEKARGVPHQIIASSSELPESPIVGHGESNTGTTQPHRDSDEHLETPVKNTTSGLIRDIDELDTTEPIPSRGADASPTHQDIRAQLISPNRDISDWARSSVMSARSLPPVEEEPNEDVEDLPKPQSDNLLRTPEINRDSGFMAESPLPARRTLFYDDEDVNRDSGVHMKDWPEETGAQASRRVTEAQTGNPRDVQTPKAEEKRGKKSQLSEETPRLSTPSRSLGETSPDPEKRSRSHAPETTKTPRSAKYESLNTGVGPALTPHAFGQQRSFSDKMMSREGTKEENTATTTSATTPRSARSTSNTSVTRLRTPEPLNLRPESPGSIRSSGTSTPPLRRVDKRMSGDLRSLSHNDNNGSVTSLHSHHHHSPHSRLTSPVPVPYPPGARPTSALSSSTVTPAQAQAPAPSASPSASPSPSALATTKAKGGSNDKDVLSALQVERRRQAAAATPTSSTPVANEGRVRAKDMTDVYDGVGEGRIGSPRSPTRPPSMRRRQSMQVLDLEAKVERLIAENRALTEARLQADAGVNQRAASTLTERDTLIEQLRSSLEEYKREVQRLKEVNEGLQSANSQLAAQHSKRYSQLESQHASTSTTLQDKDAEIQQLRDELEATKQQVREMQQQILATKPADADFLRLRDEDYFDNRCQQLCAHVQQWVLRFSKFSDMRASRLTSEINDVKIVDRLDNTVLDGSDVDDYLSDRVKRRDVFMSMTMHMVWEYVFTRYLFGMDREQRQKLKALEKLLSDVGPPHAVRQWRAVTLTLLARRPAFGDQRNDDTEAVVQAILETLSKILPPPSNMENQIQSQLRRVLREAVDLSIEMRTQRAEYMMLPPLQPEYDANGDLAETVAFNAALMNERSGGSTSNEDLEANGAVVRMVLFPLVIKKGDDNGLGDDEIVVCPAQVLVQRSSRDSRSIRMVTPSSEFGGGAPLSRGATPSVGFKSAVSLPMSPAPEGADSHMEGAF